MFDSSQVKGSLQNKSLREDIQYMDSLFDTTVYADVIDGGEVEVRDLPIETSTLLVEIKSLLLEAKALLAELKENQGGDA